MTGTQWSEEQLQQQKHWDYSNQRNLVSKGRTPLQNTVGSFRPRSLTILGGISLSNYIKKETTWEVETFKEKITL